MRKSILVTIILIFLFAGVGFASSNYYEIGDQTFTFQAGVDKSLFLYFPVTEDFLTGEDTKTNLGGYGSISYSSFFTPYLSLGGELGYTFNYSLEQKLLTTVPMLARLNYYMVQTGKFDLVAGLGMGISFTRYDENLFLTPLIQISLTPSYFISDNWGFGVETAFSTSIEFYGSNSTKPNDTVITGFMPISLKMSYRH